MNDKTRLIFVGTAIAALLGVYLMLSQALALQRESLVRIETRQERLERLWEGHAAPTDTESQHQPR